MFTDDGQFMELGCVATNVRLPSDNGVGDVPSSTDMAVDVTGALDAVSVNVAAGITIPIDSVTSVGVRHSFPSTIWQ